MSNLILNSDSYKVTHYPFMYPPKTTKIYSYLESRGGEFEETVAAGLQYIRDEYLMPGFTKADIVEAAEVFAAHFGTDKLFNKDGWMALYNKYNGQLPIEIKAVPEGSVIPTGNVLMTVENTDSEFPWLVNYLETMLLRVWYPTTVATNSRECKKVILDYLTRTGNPAGIGFKLHDFGFRGVSSLESGCIGGAAHLFNFLGTDTLGALALLRKYYGAGPAAGFSIPASEHSTITSWGKDRELEAYDNILSNFPEGLVACVIDSWDPYNAIKLFGTTLREKVLARKGTLVLRPDSGIPQDVVVKCLDLMGHYFGFSVNNLGFKVLPDQIRLIQGDGVELDSIKLILANMEKAHWSADNVAFGMGGALLQKCNRDTQKFAFKCSYTENQFGNLDVYKQPKTDAGKNSKRGRLGLKYYDGEYTTVPEWTPGNLLKTVFKNGEAFNTSTLDQIRERTAI